MNKIDVIAACSDLGVDVDGSDKGPKAIIDNIKDEYINQKKIINKLNIIKSKDPNDLKKNLYGVNEFSERLHNQVLETLQNNSFPITLGGDHSIAIGSALASQRINKNLGIIWIDAHLDYNTFDTTITGNLHGLPLAAINGICGDLTKFYSGEYINSKNTVVVGYRAEEENKDQELNNIKKMGVTVFTTNDIKEQGPEVIMKKAFDIALNGTNGVHISYDLDFIDQKYAPGVSIPELDGPDDKIALKIADILCGNIDSIKSFDLVEYNPDFDIDNKTLNLALEILNKIIEKKFTL